MAVGYPTVTYPLSLVSVGLCIGIGNGLHHPKRRDDDASKSAFGKYPRPVLPPGLVVASWTT